AIGGAAADASAVVEIKSVSSNPRGTITAPVMSAADASAIATPKYGLEVNANTTDSTFKQTGKWRWNGTSWKLVKGDSPPPAYADDAAAGAAGLDTGDMWQTSSTNSLSLPAGVLMIKQ